MHLLIKTAIILVFSKSFNHLSKRFLNQSLTTWLDKSG